MPYHPTCSIRYFSGNILNCTLFITLTCADDDDDDDDWDEDDENEMIGTPLDDMDPFVSFADVLSGVQASMPGRYSALMAGADANVTAALQGMSAHAAAIKAKKAAEQQQQ